jgi:putative ABC transport system ATP-binding protein
MLVQVRELYRFFHIGDDETVALRGVSLELVAGELVALTGPSGSGKSTLLSCIAGLDEPDGGVVIVAGQQMTRRSEAIRSRMRARNLGILLQSGNLFQHLTVAENIRLQMMLAGKMDEARLTSLMNDAGIDHRSNGYPAQLSGGEVARAGLAVALAVNPLVLIADEPTAEVDKETEQRLIGHFEARRHQGTATLLATHSEALAARADRVIRLIDGRVS